MAEQHIILAVDDEPLNLEILEELLEDDYQIITAENGQICLDIIKQINPVLVLMDVDMPTLGGLEACERLKSDPEVSKIPIIFVSALATRSEKMAGYKSGGEDYITKPFDEDELRVKIDLTIKASAAIIKQEENAAETMSMAMTAMSAAGDIGTVLRFAHSSFSAKTADELAELLLGSYATYGLMVTIRYLQDGVAKYYSHCDIIGETEKQIMETGNSQGRFVDFGQRTLVNYSLISVLIKNMPIDDEMKYGRMKDNSGLLGDAAEARAKLLAFESALTELLLSSREILSEVEQNYQQKEMSNKNIVNGLNADMKLALENLDLERADEQNLVNILYEAEEQSQLLYRDGLHIKDKVNRLMENMARFF